MNKLNVFKWTVPSALILCAGSVIAGDPPIVVDGDKDSGLYSTFPAVRQASKAIDELLAGPVSASAQSDQTVPMGGEGVGDYAGSALNGPTADVLTGYEGRLNLAALGWDGGDINLTAFVAGGNFLSNQVTGGIEPAQSGNIGNSSPFDFVTMTGSQFVTVASSSTSTTAPTIDGVADDAPYALLADGGTMSGWSQETFTQFGDNNNADREANSGGSEIDGVYGYIYDPDGIANNGDEEFVFTITGNLENGGNRLVAFFDVNAANGAATGFMGGIDLGDYSGGTLEFGADAAFVYNRSGDANGHFTGLTTLDNAGASVISQGSFVSPLPANMVITDGAMVPTTLLVADFDNSNVVGVAGSEFGGSFGGSDEPTETDPAMDDTGVEMKINLSDLGYDPMVGFDGAGGGVRVSGFVIEANAVSNQIIGGLPADAGPLDAVGGVDFDAIAGDQFAVVGDTSMTSPIIDGTKDSAYGPTEYVNNVDGTGNATNRTSPQGPTGADDDPMGSEINNFSGVLVEEGGEWQLYMHTGGALGNFDRLYLYVDHTDEAGENQLSGFNPNIDDGRSNNASGLKFDDGFDADALFVYRLGTDDMSMEVRHFFEGVEITTSAEDLEIGGSFGGGAKADVIDGTIVATRGFGDNDDPEQANANGDELAGLFAYLGDRTVAGNTEPYVTLLLTGNLKPVFNKVNIFLDIDPTFGQNSLIWDGDIMTGDITPPTDPNYVGNPQVDDPGGNGGALQTMGGPFPDLGTEEDLNDTIPGLTFDAGFEPDHFITVTIGNLSDGADLMPGTADDDAEIFANFARLRSPGPDGLFDADNTGDDDPGFGNFLGMTTVQGSPNLSTTPSWEIAINNSNVFGVPGGVSSFGITAGQSAQIAGVGTGIEISFPASDIVLDPTGAATPWDGTGSFGVHAFIVDGGHTFMSSQALPPVCNDELGDPRRVDYSDDATYQDQQYVILEAPMTGLGSYTVAAGQDFLTRTECVEPVGACCMGESCAVMTQSDCESMSGEFLGNATDCGAMPLDNPCLIVSACCFDDNSCLPLSSLACEMAGGTSQAEGVLCSDMPDPCAPENDCFYDTNNDGLVDIIDFGAFGTAFGSSDNMGMNGNMSGIPDANFDPALDSNGDGLIDIIDFGLFGMEFNRTDCLDAG